MFSSGHLPSHHFSFGVTKTFIVSQESMTQRLPFPCTQNIRLQRFLLFRLGQGMDGAVFMGSFQGFITHVMHRIWKTSSSKHSRDLCYNYQHDVWCHILRAFYCLFHKRYPDHGFPESALQGKGRKD